MSALACASGLWYTHSLFLNTLVCRQARVKAKANKQLFYDMGMLSGRFPASLPESLRPRAGHTQPHHQRVYEDFARIPRGAGAAASAAAGPPGALPLPGAHTSQVIAFVPQSFKAW